MGIILFLIVMCSLAFVGFIINSAATNKTDQGIILPTKPKFKNAKDMQNQFLEAYMWTCCVFGVRKNVYDSLDRNISEYPSLGINYFTYYYVSKYSENYPNICQTVSSIYVWDSVTEQENFVIEFLGIVNKLRNRIDVEEIKLFSKYNIPFKNLLTREFKVDNMQLFSLPQ